MVVNEASLGGMNAEIKDLIEPGSASRIVQESLRRIAKIESFSEYHTTHLDHKALRFTALCNFRHRSVFYQHSPKLSFFWGRRHADFAAERRQFEDQLAVMDRRRQQDSHSLREMKSKIDELTAKNKNLKDQLRSQPVQARQHDSR